MKPERRRFGRRPARFLAGAGVALAGVALAGDWTGFGWVSGPAALGAIGSWLLAFAFFSSLPSAAGGDDWTNTPNVSGNTDNE